MLIALCGCFWLTDQFIDLMGIPIGREKHLADAQPAVGFLFLGVFLTNVFDKLTVLILV
jgi:hypothetical protein